MTRFSSAPKFVPAGAFFYYAVARTLLRTNGSDKEAWFYLGASVGEAIGAAVGLLWCIGLCIFMLM